MIYSYSTGHYLNLVFLLSMRLTNTGSGKWNSRSILLSIPTYPTIVLLMSGEVCLCSDCIPIKGPLILEGGIVDEARYNQEHNLFEQSSIWPHLAFVHKAQTEAFEVVIYCELIWL